MAPPASHDIAQQMLNDLGLDMSPEELDPWLAQFDHSGEFTETDRQVLSAFGPDRAPDVSALTKLRRDQSVREKMDKDLLRMSTPCPGYGYAYTKHPYKSSAPSPGCKEICKICSRSFLCGLKMVACSYTACFTDTAAQEKLDALTSGTLNNLAEVRTKLDKYGDTILRKW